MGQRGAEQVKAWEAAVGEEQALRVAVEEHTRQHSAMLAREIDLQRQLEAAQQMQPRERALATHQAQGDELNMLTAELHKNDRELEWWQANRDELRKTQTLKSQALAQLVKGNEGLQRKVGAVQRLMDTDAETASKALADVMAVPAIFKLMAPEVEHVVAVAGTLPFMEKGSQLPREVQSVVQRLLQPEQGHERLPGRAQPHQHLLEAVGAGHPGVDVPALGRQRLQRHRARRGRRRELPPGAGRHGASPRTPGPWTRSPTPSCATTWRRRWSTTSSKASSPAWPPTPTASPRGRPSIPAQAFGAALQWRAMRGEDIARFAQFIDGLESGMGAHAARMWTGKYHFFNSELTEAERTYLKPLYPFYAYLRNNFALQFSTLFHQPGKIALYGTAMRDFSAQPEGSTAPGWVEQAGGFPVGGKDLWLQNTILDTSPLGLPQTILGLAQSGEGISPANVLQGEGLSSMGPAVQAGRALVTGTSAITGEPMYPQEMAPSLKPLTSALQALHLVNDAGKWNPRVLASYQALLPQVSRGVRGGIELASAAGALPEGAGLHPRPGRAGQVVLDQPAARPRRPEADPAPGCGSLRRAGPGRGRHPGLPHRPRGHRRPAQGHRARPPGS